MINETTLRELLAKAFEAGYEGSLDLKDSYVEETIRSLSNPGWRVYTVAELRGMPHGTIFTHQTKGRGIVQANGFSLGSMLFDNGEVFTFIQDSKPWTEPMIIGENHV